MAWRADWMSAAFWKSTAVYGHIDENGSSVRKWPARKMAITDRMVKNGRLSVKIQPFRTWFYGQMLRKAACVRKSSVWWAKIYGQITGKCQFVRKIRFAYGQIIKNGGFVRKSGLNFGWMVEQHHFKKGSFCAENQRNVLKSQSKTDCLRSIFHLIRARNGTFFPVSSLGQIKWTISWKMTRNSKRWLKFWAK